MDEIKISKFLLLPLKCQFLTMDEIKISKNPVPMPFHAKYLPARFWTEFYVILIALMVFAAFPVNVQDPTIDRRRRVSSSTPTSRATCGRPRRSTSGSSRPP